ncbi:dephospho-CoA kinase [Falsarthrobacter nasiphocae]|uniref:Dephospho-CoA kinase n=1 Tax=Falsarthrobacter nasiphocae TaxID=189863 RepID=A0AAE3YFC0_9MICC|nr:dephospho-CoA kinase [Falsarthrobacter nasiphocae]MDR6891177.1 dephospho-CoA kinase [Falsarthrobacter nasiphocae]
MDETASAMPDPAHDSSDRPVFALTGGIAAGKSAVAARLAERGAVVVDSDVLARRVVEPGQPALAEVAEAFGPGVLEADGTLDRAALGALVFGDDDARARLNAILHPAIRAAAADAVEAARRAGARVIVQDIPLLAETGRAGEFAFVATVEADDETRIERMVTRRGMTREAAEARIAAQATRAEREAVADLVIENEGSLEDLHRAADELWETLEGLAAR